MAKLDITKLNTRKPDYEIPEDYQVLNIFSYSPMRPDVFILGRKYGTAEYAIFRFDGISEIPIMYETFIDIK